MSLRLVPSLILLATAGLPAAELITVTAPPEPAPRLLPPASDPAAALRGLPGLAGIRMGGVGIDPVARGQSASRLLVLADGACPHGGCPNRMDPPATYAAAGADQVAIEAGGLGVRRPGAPLAVVSLERPRPRFAEGRWHEARAAARVDANGEAARGDAAFSVGNALGWAQARAAASHADDYEDGDGRQVRSGHRRWSAGGSLGWTPGQDTSLEVAHDAVRENDALYAGAGMDAVYSHGDTTLLRLQHRPDDGLLARLDLDAYRVAVEHLMDNYSLRPVSGMAMRADTSNDTTGGRMLAELRLPAGLLGLGLDAERQDYDARRSIATTGALNSALIPDARLDRAGAWADLAIALGGATRLVPGVRVDLVASSARDAAVDPPGASLSPDGLYALYHGRRAEDRDETLLGAALRLEHDLGDSTQLTVAASRQQRAADPTERFIAANGALAARWVGNPGLDPETHWLAQVGAAGDHGAAGRWTVEAWADRVQDYIRRDRARGQDGILRTDRATIYRNGAALLAGATAAGELATGELLRWSADASWTRGDDLDSGLPLPQIPPLSGRVAGRVGDDQLHGLLTMRWAARATRVDDDDATGADLDAGETPAWLVLDVAAAWNVAPGIALSAGIDNLLDRTYAEHLNKPSAFDTTVQRVNEPGRSLWLAAQARF
jgi:iron complex outermembrane receptor protein